MIDCKKTQKKALEDWEKKVNYHFDFTNYEVGMWVWLQESQLDETKGNKGEWTYLGPYIIHRKLAHDVFILHELSGVVIKGHIHRLRLFFYRPENQTLKTSLDPRYRRTMMENDQDRLDIAQSNMIQVLEDLQPVSYSLIWDLQVVNWHDRIALPITIQDTPKWFFFYSSFSFAFPSFSLCQNNPET